MTHKNDKRKYKQVAIGTNGDKCVDIYYSAWKGAATAMGCLLKKDSHKK